MKVYPAGGMRTTWQDEIIAAMPDVEFLDPRKHGLSDPADYTAWDLDAVRRADAIVAGMSADNPSGYGLSLEVGFAHGLGTPIVFLDLLGTDWRGRYFDMHRQVSQSVTTVAEAIEALRRLA